MGDWLPRTLRLTLMFYCIMSRSQSVYSFCGGQSEFCPKYQLYPPLRIHPPRKSPHRLDPLSMKIKVGIVGLPNVGKSTLFNALSRKSIAQAENFPFCTVEPNVALIAVPDPNLPALAALAASNKAVPATMEFVDVAGLVAGASRGEGLGNRFLATIRECNAICHLVRYFDDNQIVHVDGRVDPRKDAEVVNLELVLADIAHIERRLEKTTCQELERETLESLLPELHKGIPARSVGLSPSGVFAIKSMGLLTLKPVIYVFNVDEVDFLLAKEDTMANAGQIVGEIQYCDPSRATFTVVSAKLEAKIASLADEKAQREYLVGMGVDLDDKAPLDDLMSYSVLPSMVKDLLNLFLVYTGQEFHLSGLGPPKLICSPSISHQIVCSLPGDFMGTFKKDLSVRRSFLPLSYYSIPITMKQEQAGPFEQRAKTQP